MARDWIDAEFEVVWAPLRRGDPHPTRKGVRFVRYDPWGRPLWRIPPRFNLWQRALMVLAGMFALELAALAVDVLTGHY